MIYVPWALSLRGAFHVFSCLFCCCFSGRVELIQCSQIYLVLSFSKLVFEQQNLDHGFIWSVHQNYRIRRHLSRLPVHRQQPNHSESPMHITPFTLTTTAPIAHNIFAPCIRSMLPRNAAGFAPAQDSLALMTFALVSKGVRSWDACSQPSNRSVVVVYVRVCVAIEEGHYKEEFTVRVRTVERVARAI